jgi:hypothetical protein
LLKYKSPGVKGSLSLSSVGSLAFCPKYISSKLSVAVRAASLALFAALAASEAVLAKLLELLAKLDELLDYPKAAVALDGAEPACVVAVAAFDEAYPA